MTVINRNITAERKSVNPEKKMDMSFHGYRKMESLSIKFCSGEEVKKIKIKTAATFSS